MRKVLGGAVLVLGTGALGWYGTANNAVRMEDRVTDEAQSVSADTVHPTTVDVSGRDIVVTGIANSEAERDSIVAALMAVDGRRVVRDDLQVLRTASPFVFGAEDTGEARSFSGLTPTETARTDLAVTIGDDGAAELELAAGAPDAWNDAIRTGLSGLDGLLNGTLDVADTDVTLRGVALNPDARDAAITALEDLPEGYNATTEIDVLDDGTPFRLTADFVASGVVTATGKLPEGVDAALLAPLGDDIAAEELVTARIGDDAGWTETATQGVDALSRLQEGTLVIDDQTVTLTGTATRADRAAAEDLMAGIAAPFDVTADISVFDDGAPMTLRAAKTAAGITSVGGKLPFETTAEAIGA
ncbi:MAG: BON domain-containing protein, partial [Shimia sp.]